MALDMSDQLQA